VRACVRVRVRVRVRVGDACRVWLPNLNLNLT